MPKLVTFILQFISVILKEKLFSIKKYIIEKRIIMNGYHLGKLLNKYNKRKYGRNFERAEKNNDIIYKAHYIFCIILILSIPFIKNPYELLFAFAVEIIIFLLLMLNPSFLAVGGIILPLLGMLIDIIVWLIVIKIHNILKLDININYITNLITVILNLIVNTFIIRKVNKKNELIELLLKVNSKVPLNYDCSLIVFEDNNEKKYFINTDLDEKFKQGQLYKVKLKNKNISSKLVNIKENECYEIKGIDGSCFKCKD